MMRKIKLRSDFSVKAAGTFSVLVALTCCLSACGGDDKHTALLKYIQEVKVRVGNKVEPLPTQKVFKPYLYPTNLVRRSPFVKVVERNVQGLGPDQSRPKQPLEAFQLDSLRMVGTLNENNQLWAVIKAPNDLVFRVAVGCYIGQNYGLITKVTENEVDVIETVGSNGNWEKRPAKLSLVEGE